MDFETDAQREVYEKVAPLLGEIFGEFAQPSEERPMVFVNVGSAVAQVAVWPWHDDDATITTRAYVVTDVEVTPELMRHLLSMNNDMRFGAFGLDSDDDVFFEHSILGTDLSKDELRASVMAVVLTADRLDDEIVSRFGGRRALDSTPEQ